MRSHQVIGLRHNLTIHLAALGMACLLLMACADLQLSDSFPTTDPSSPLSSPVVLDLRVLVVGRHPVAVAQASDDLRRLGFTVLQRDRIERILNEQDPHLNNAPAAHAYVLRSAGLSGPKWSWLST